MMLCTYNIQLSTLLLLTLLESGQCPSATTHAGYCSLLMSSHLLLVNSNVIWLVIGPAVRLQTSFRGALSGGVWWVAGLLPLLVWSLVSLV